MVTEGKSPPPGRNTNEHCAKRPEIRWEDLKTQGNLTLIYHLIIKNTFKIF